MGDQGLSANEIVINSQNDTKTNETNTESTEKPEKEASTAVNITGQAVSFSSNGNNPQTVSQQVRILFISMTVYIYASVTIVKSNLLFTIVCGIMFSM